MKLTWKAIALLKIAPGKSERTEYDDDIDGFYFRIRGDNRSLGLRYTIGKQERRYKLCDATAEAFPHVRKTAAELRARIQLGFDPMAEKQAKRQAEKPSDIGTFKSVATLYLAKQAKEARPRSVEEDTRYLMVKAKALHDKPLVAILRRDIAELLTSTENTVNGHGKKNGAATTNRMSAVLSGMFKWGMQEGLCEHNPVTGTNKRPEPSRDRVLSVPELVEIWKALPDDYFGWAVKLLILTAQRKTEIAGLLYSEIDLAKGVIVLPKHRVKNGREHTLPLSQGMLDILERIPRIVDQATLFGAAEGRNWGDRKTRLDKRLLEARKAAFGADAIAIPHWVIHDLRRSVATHMGELLDVEPHVIEALLNHQSGSKAGVAGVYNRSKYAAQVRTALTLWSEHLMAAVTDTSAKITPLRLGKAG